MISAINGFMYIPRPINKVNGIRYCPVKAIKFRNIILNIFILSLNSIIAL